MIVFTSSVERGAHDRSAAILFGTGLVGQGILAQMTRQDGVTATELPYDWADEGKRRFQLRQIGRILTTTEIEKVDFIWAAGRSGFTSSADELQQETLLVEEIVNFSRTLPFYVDWHLFSSAGGLFEGQVLVDLWTKPLPRRAYGNGKFAQERLLLQQLEYAPNIISVSIYRPSSVIGFSSKGRRNLVSALIFNALRGRETTISGSPHTLRDFISASDIGRFVVKRLQAAKSPGAATFLLASGRPTSIATIMQLVDQLTPQPLFVRFDPRPLNALPMSFRPSSIPSDLKLTNLELAVSETFHAIRQL
jgi:UDP-glucose 4-epimerase